MYDKFYNLTALPFRLSPDPRFLYQSRNHSKAMAYLRYGLQLGEGFMIITGDVGTGKTTLARSLLLTLNKANILAAQLVTTQLESDDMLRMVSTAFGMSSRDLPKATLLSNLESFLRANAKAGKRALLVVDEAQNLPEKSLEELRMLSNYQVGEKALLQCFLLGQEEFRQTLQGDGMEQFRQRVIAAYHLGPMDEADTRKYIEHRLRTAGWKDDPRFEDAAFPLIYQATEGVPRRINSLCDRLLLLGALDEAHALGPDRVQVVIDEQQQELPKRAREEPVIEEETEDNPSLAPLPAGAAEALAFESEAELAPQFARGQVYDTPPVSSTVISDVERRMIALERRVEQLEAIQKKDRERIKKLIMLSLFSDGEIDFEAALKRLGKVEEG